MTKSQQTMSLISDTCALLTFCLKTTTRQNATSFANYYYQTM